MKVIPHLPDYKITEDGRVWSDLSKIWLKQYITPHGYYYVRPVTPEKKHVTGKIHRLVAQTYLPKPQEGKGLVCHKDGTRTNNHYTNLYWGDRRDNVNDAIKHGSYQKGAAKKSRLTSEQVIALRIVYSMIPKGKRGIFLSSFDIEKSIISKAVTRTSWKQIESIEDLILKQELKDKQ